MDDCPEPVSVVQSDSDPRDLISAPLDPSLSHGQGPFQPPGPCPKQASTRLGKYVVDPVKNVSDYIFVFFSSCCCVDCCKHWGPIDVFWRPRPLPVRSWLVSKPKQATLLTSSQLIICQSPLLSPLPSCCWLLQAQRTQPWRFLSSLW